MGASNVLVATLLSMAGQRNVLTIPRAFVQFTKSIEAAMLLNQLLYWIPRGHDDGSIYKSDKEWQEELCLTRYSVRQARERLEAMGFLHTELHRVRGAPTVHYFLDYDALVNCWSEWLRTDGRLSEIEQSDYPFSDNRAFEIEQSDRAKTDNDIVRNRTNIKEHEIPAKTPPPPPNPPAPAARSGGGGGGSEQPTETQRALVRFGFSARSAARFRDLPLDVVQTELKAARQAGTGPGGLVERWKVDPPGSAPPARAAPNAPVLPTRIERPPDVLSPQDAARVLNELRKKQQEIPHG